MEFRRLKPIEDSVPLASRMAEPGDTLLPLINASPDKPFVIAQLGQSLDGRIATPSGQSRWINRGCALDHLHRLRANVDAVIVGSKTVMADNPALTVRRIAGNNPIRIVIDPTGRVSPAARIFADDGIASYVVAPTRTSAGPGETIELEATAEGISPQAIIAALAARGIRKILIEGGATTVSRFIDAGAVNRLHLLVAPAILGSGTTGISLKAIGNLDEARRPPTTVHVLDDGDVLFDCALA